MMATLTDLHMENTDLGLKHRVTQLSRELDREQHMNRLFRVVLLVLMVLLLSMLWWGNEKILEIRKDLPTIVRDSMHLEMIQHAEFWAEEYKCQVLYPNGRN